MLSSKRIIFCNICVEQFSDDLTWLEALKTDLRHILTRNLIFLFIGKKYYFKIHLSRNNMIPQNNKTK